MCRSWIWLMSFSCHFQFPSCPREKNKCLPSDRLWIWGLRFLRVWLWKILPSETWDRVLCEGPFRHHLKISVTRHDIISQKPVFFSTKYLFLGSWKQETNIVTQTIPNVVSRKPDSNFVYDSVSYFCVAWFRRNLQILLLLHVMWRGQKSSYTLRQQ
jgi:hypothetical protein